MKNIKKTYILSLLILLVLPFTGQASSSLSELTNELRTASIALTGLSQDSVIRKNQLSFISQELNRIASAVNSVSSNSNGRVLGATSNNSSSSSNRGAIANVNIEVGNSKPDRVYIEGNKKNVLSFKLEPEDSDIWVQSVEVSFEGKVWRYVDNISLIVGNKVLAKIDDIEEDDFSESDDDAYSIRFSNFSYYIKEGRSKEFRIRVESTEDSSSGEVRVFLDDNAVRFKDQGNYSQQIPYRSGGSRGTFSNQFEVVEM